MGTQVVIPYREEDDKRHLKLTGDLGQIVPMEWDIRNEQQIAECLRHSDIVYNLVGRDYETKNFSFSDVHAKGAARIARIAAEAGVSRFVHLSHLNASHDSKSKFYRSKAEGEELVKEAFPNATIIRPGSMFGYEDRLLTNMAYWPMWWQLNGGRTKMRPVHVVDVAQALVNLVHSRPVPGTFSLPGPSTFTIDYLLEFVQSVAYLPPSRLPHFPKPFALAIAKLAQAPWFPLVSPDEIERRYIDDSDVAADWEAFGVRPDHIEDHALAILRRFRSADNFMSPLVFPPRPSVA
jgi:NADH dehydrogenase (ubiquinone) 1 alpha subcomplex subunit 9